jgi:hypothetical protein
MKCCSVVFGLQMVHFHRAMSTNLYIMRKVVDVTTGNRSIVIVSHFPVLSIQIVVFIVPLSINTNFTECYL